MIKQRKKLNQYAVSTNTLDDPTGNSEFVLIIHEMSLTDATELASSVTCEAKFSFLELWLCKVHLVFGMNEVVLLVKEP